MLVSIGLPSLVLVLSRNWKNPELIHQLSGFTLGYPTVKLFQKRPVLTFRLFARAFFDVW